MPINLLILPWLQKHFVAIYNTKTHVLHASFILSWNLSIIFTKMNHILKTHISCTLKNYHKGLWLPIFSTCVTGTKLQIFFSWQQSKLYQAIGIFNSIDLKFSHYTTVGYLNQIQLSLTCTSRGASKANKNMHKWANVHTVNSIN